MRDGDDLSLMGVRKTGCMIDWRKDRGWGNNDGPSNSIRKHMELQSVLHNFSQP